MRLRVITAVLICFAASSMFARGNDRSAADHLLSRVTFGPTTADEEHVAAVGIDAYIDEQLDPGSIDDADCDKRIAAIPTLRSATPPLIERYSPVRAVAVPASLPLPFEMPAPKGNAKPAAGPQPVVTDLERATLLRAVYSRRQLYERMVRFWENHFSVYVDKDADRLYMTSFDRDTIRPFALGDFRQLLGAVAHSPAMLYYLDNWRSAGARDAASTRPLRRRSGLNENYARELLELHTMGVDGGYTQHDVEEVARCFTGWTIFKVNDVGLFMFDPALHDNGGKVVLGHRIPPNGGIADGEMVLDILAHHPSTARFIATKFARMLISDEPPQRAIDRAANVFLETNGSIVATLRSILTSREFLSRKSFDAKVKSPFEYAVSAVRATGASTDGGPALLSWIARMGEPMFGRITPDGFPDRAETWISTGILLDRMNFAIALTNNQIGGTRVEKPGNAVALRIGEPQFQMR